MQLTRYSDYSLRVLIHLAVTGRPLTTIEEIARAYGISHAHLTKVVQHLSALGLVETVRGRRGGLRLARAPDQVDVGQLIRNTEENLALVECFQPDGECPIKPACVLRQALDEALEAFLAVLDRYTLADLVSRRRAVLARLLTIEGA
jgi:Rrf2 family nitric oxide-sensitive transcriptional repressor